LDRLVIGIVLRVSEWLPLVATRTFGPLAARRAAADPARSPGAAAAASAAAANAYAAFLETRRGTP
jgi:hypothetical protein